MKQLDKAFDNPGGLPSPFNETHNLAAGQSFGNKENNRNNIIVIKHRGGQIEPFQAGANYYSLALCLKGSAVRTINQYRFRVGPGSIHLARPGSLNAYHEASDDLELHTVMFTGEFLAESIVRDSMIGNLLEERKEGAPFFHLDENTAKMITPLFEKLDNEVNTDKPFHGQLARLLFAELMLETSRFCRGSDVQITWNTSRQHQLTIKFKSLIEDNYMTLRTVQEYADKLFVTAKHLSEVVKQETGLNPLHHIHSRVFQESKFWLCGSGLSIKEIAWKLNFDTSSHFSRFFKQYTGYNPSEFQRIQCAI